MWNREWQPAVAQILHDVEISIMAEQIFCSVTTEMKYMPVFRDQPALAEVHKENYETSYHRNTAAGNLRRWLTGSGPSAEQLILMTVECFVETRVHDKKAENALMNVKGADPADESWLQAAVKWHKRRKASLKHAARLLKATIPPELWDKGVSLAE